jgi:carboxypeptidase C (cathepsin A)
MKRLLSRCAVALWLSLFLCSASAQKDGEHAQPAEAPASPVKASVATQPVTTEHAVTVNGQRIEYTATAATIPITDDSGKLQANIFYVAYARKGADAETPRPVTFAFNGGPGASSMWLHLGIGPKRVNFTQQGTAPPSTPGLLDNDATWLDFTDLVFVDPIGTGFSRTAEGIDPKQFYELRNDVQVAGSFIRRYLTRYQLWLSPKFIVGESYGTTRVAALVNRLQDVAGIDVRGVILVSSALDFQTFSFDPANDIAYALVLPSYAATAWYHNQRRGRQPGRDLASTLSDAEQWATGEYLAALAKGDAMQGPQRARIAGELARYTGLPQPEVERNRLRVGPLQLGRKLLRKEELILGRFDSRVTAAALGASDNPESDPAFVLVTGPLVQALNDYLQRELQYRTDLRYEFLSREANRSWKWSSGGQGYVYVSDELAEAMSRDDRLRVFAAAGVFDLATPYFAQRYTFEHMGLPAQLRSHLTFETYPTGHQIYTDPASARKLKSDVESFMSCALSMERCSTTHP